MDSGSLVFSVILYTSCSIGAIVILMLRRNIRALGGAELGGPVAVKYACGIVFCLLWVFYVVMSSLQTEKIITVNI